MKENELVRKRQSNRQLNVIKKIKKMQTKLRKFRIQCEKKSLKCVRQLSPSPCETEQNQCIQSKKENKMERENLILELETAWKDAKQSKYQWREKEKSYKIL